MESFVSSDTKPEPETKPEPLDWLEGDAPIPAEGEPATGKQWMYWFEKRDREAQDNERSKLLPGKTS